MFKTNPITLVITAIIFLCFGYFMHPSPKVIAPPAPIESKIDTTYTQMQNECRNYIRGEYDLCMNAQLRDYVESLGNVTKDQYVADKIKVSHARLAWKCRSNDENVFNSCYKEEVIKENDRIKQEIIRLKLTPGSN